MKLWRKNVEYAVKQRYNRLKQGIGVRIMNNFLKSVFIYVIAILISFLTFVILLGSQALVLFLPYRLLVCSIPLISYFLMGKRLSVEEAPKYDFLAGIYFTVVNLALWTISFINAGSSWGVISEENTRLFWSFFRLFNSPMVLIEFATNFKLNTPLINLIIIFIPPILISLGLKWSRRKSLKLHSKPV
jgi:hypothetical protein